MAKEKKVTLVNSGLSAIFIGRTRILPDEEIEIDADSLTTSGIEYLVFRGELSVVSDKSAEKEIKERVSKRVKKDPNEGKTLKELEDGGEY